MKPKIITEKLIAILVASDFIKELSNVQGSFTNVPSFYVFLILRHTSKIYKAKGRNLYSYGFSIKDSYVALLNCLLQTIQKINLYSYQYTNIHRCAYSDFRKDEVIDPSLLSNIISDRNLQFGWILLKNIITNKYTKLPAQLVFFEYITSLFYEQNFYEKTLSERISLDASTGLSQKEAIVTGIYQKIAQDSAMLTHLLKYEAKKVQVDKINLLQISEKLHYCKKNNISWHLFDITTELGIPTFMTILEFNSKKYSTLFFGYSSHLNNLFAVINSFNNAMGTLIDSQLILNSVNIKMGSRREDDFLIDSKVKRLVYLHNTNIREQYAFLLNQKPQRLVLQDQKISINMQYNSIINTLKKANIDMYAFDITNKIFRGKSVYSFKIILPQLQPCYINEKMKILKHERIKTFTRFINKKVIKLNTDPHPFVE